MDIVYRIRGARDLTPTEQHLATSVLSLGDRVQGYTIKELAQVTATSIASIHRLCRKLGLEGFKELKVELARSEARRGATVGTVDINFPFQAGETADAIAPRMELLYEETLRETRETLEAAEVDRAAALIAAAEEVDIYTCSHNLYPANMFCDRLLSAGRRATCHESAERQIRTALGADARHVAVMISYSGAAPGIAGYTPVLKERGCPIILIGTPHAARLHPGLDAYLKVSDNESLSHRITQFASHIAVQYALDTLFGCFFARTYEESLAFLERSFPYMRHPAEATPASMIRAGVAQSPTGPGEGVVAAGDSTLDLIQSLR